MVARATIVFAICSNILLLDAFGLFTVDCGQYETFLTRMHPAFFSILSESMLSTLLPLMNRDNFRINGFFMTRYGGTARGEFLSPSRLAV